MPPEQIVQRLLIMRRIFAYRGVRTATGFDTQNPLLWEHTPLRQKLRIFFGKDIVRHHRQAVPIPEFTAKGLNQRCFPGSDRPANSDDRNMSRPCRRHAPCATKMFIGPMHAGIPQMYAAHYCRLIAEEPPSFRFPTLRDTPSSKYSYDRNSRDSNRLCRIA